jgi:hypothetical protein
MKSSAITVVDLSLPYSTVVRAIKTSASHIAGIGSLIQEAHHPHFGAGHNYWSRRHTIHTLVLDITRSRRHTIHTLVMDITRSRRHTIHTLVMDITIYRHDTIPTVAAGNDS